MCDPSARDTAQLKKKVRAAALTRREALSDLIRSEKSSLIFNRLIRFEQFRKARCVFIYVSVRSEVQTEGIVRAALAQGKTVCVPLVDKKNKEVIACSVSDPERDLHPGTMGIPEPDRLTCPTVSACDIDCVLVPGLAFTEQGHRIGYGGGFYDRFLNEWPGFSCALAFEEQIVANLPFDPAHDVAVRRIITDQRDINCVL
jgi:5-formyltetrahydrofolate cyclo-ligase